MWIEVFLAALMTMDETRSAEDAIAGYNDATDVLYRGVR
jgi:hypothetical protein